MCGRFKHKDAPEFAVGTPTDSGAVSWFDAYHPAFRQFSHYRPHRTAAYFKLITKFAFGRERGVKRHFTARDPFFYFPQSFFSPAMHCHNMKFLL
jgi:hypothetical protein